MAQRLFELAELRRRMRRERVFRDRTNPLDTYNDEELFKRYRFSREGIQYVCDLIEENIRRPTQRNHAMLPVHSVCIALQYYTPPSSLDLAT